MSDINYSLWRWRPEEGVIVKASNLKEDLSSVALRLLPEWEAEVSTDTFEDNTSILKQMEHFVSGIPENDEWNDPPPLNLA